MIQSSPSCPHHRGVPTEQRYSALSAGYSCQFSSPSGLSHHVSITNLLYAKPEKSKACPHAAIYHRPTLTPLPEPHLAKLWKWKVWARAETDQHRTVKTHKAYGEELRYLICGLEYTELVISELSSHKQLINHHTLITTRGDKPLLPSLNRHRKELCDECIGGKNINTPTCGLAQSTFLLRAPFWEWFEWQEERQKSIL